VSISARRRARRRPTAPSQLALSRRPFLPVPPRPRTQPARMSSFDDGGYAPNMEPALMLSNDRTNLEGLALQGIAYGAHLLVFCLAAAALLRPGAMVTHASPRRRAALLLYIFVMFSIGYVP
jgi:hypothetical protein